MQRVLTGFRTVPIWATAAGILIVVASFAAVATLSVNTVSTTVKITDEALTSDSGSSVTNGVLTQTGSTVSAEGTAVGTAVEATTSLPTVSSGVTSGYWMYTIEVKEASNAAWTSSPALQSFLGHPIGG